MSNRGLHNFLTEIYSGATKQDIDTRINIELAKIKKAFFSPKLSAYNRKKYITKLCFIVLSGIRVCFGLPQIIDLIDSKKISSQRIGWMAAVIICGNDSSQINELMSSIEKHLADSKNENGINFTLSAIASIGGSELAETFGPTIAEIALSTNYNDYTRKKALLALVSFYRCSQLQLIGTIAGRLTSLLCDPSYGLRLSVCHLIQTIQIFQPSSVFDIFDQILENLTNFFIKNDYDHEYSTSDVPCSILSAQMIRILSFNTNWNSSAMKVFENIAISLLNRYNLKRSEDGLISYFTVFAEIVYFSLAIPISDTLRDKIYQVLIDNLNSPVLPVRYFCIDNLSTFIRFFPHLGSTHQFSLLPLYEMMASQDPELNCRSIQLLYIIANKENGLDILTEFLNYMPKAPLYIKDILFQKSSLLTLSFSLDEKWCIDTLIKLICDCKINHQTDFLKFITLYIYGNQEKQIYLIKKIYSMLTSNEFEVNFTNQFVQLSAYVIGEYSNLIKSEIKVNIIIDKLILFYQNIKSSDLCKNIIVTCFFKLCINQKSCRNELIKFIKNQCYSSIVDVSQRCCEYTRLLSNFPASFLVKLSTVSSQRGSIPSIKDISIEKFKESGIKSQIRINAAKSTNALKGKIVNSTNYLNQKLTAAAANVTRQSKVSQMSQNTANSGKQNNANFAKQSAANGNMNHAQQSYYNSTKQNGVSNNGNSNASSTKQSAANGNMNHTQQSYYNSMKQGGASNSNASSTKQSAANGNMNHTQQSYYNSTKQGGASNNGNIKNVRQINNGSMKQNANNNASSNSIKQTTSSLSYAQQVNGSLKQGNCDAANSLKLQVEAVDSSNAWTDALKTTSYMKNNESASMSNSSAIARSSSAPINVKAIKNRMSQSSLDTAEKQQVSPRAFFDDDDSLSLDFLSDDSTDDSNLNDAHNSSSHFLNANEGEIFSSNLCTVSVSFVIFPPNAKVAVIIKYKGGGKMQPSPHSFNSMDSNHQNIKKSSKSSESESTTDGEEEEEEEEETSNSSTTTTNNCYSSEKDFLMVKNFTISAVDDLKFRVINFPDSGFIEIEPGRQIEVKIEFVAVGIFDQMPILTFEANSETVKANLPIIFPRWIKEMEMDKNTFLSRWNAISDTNNSAFVSLVIPDGDVMSSVKILAKKNFGLEPLNIELPENIVVMCGVFKCLNKSIGFLLRFVFNEHDNDLSLMIKTTSPLAINILRKRASNAFIL